MKIKKIKFKRSPVARVFGFRQIAQAILSFLSALPSMGDSFVSFTKTILDVAKKIAPIAFVVSTVISLYNIYRDGFAIHTKGGKFRTIEKSVRIGVSVATIAFTLTAMIAPPVALTMLICAIAVGVVMDVLSLVKVSIRFHRDNERLKHGFFIDDGYDTKQYQQLKRKFKIAGRSVDVFTGVLMLVGIGCALASGPWGWILVGAVVLAALTVKLSLLIARKVQCKAKKPEILKTKKDMAKLNVLGIQGLKQRISGKYQVLGNDLDNTAPIKAEQSIETLPFPLCLPAYN